MRTTPPSIKDVAQHSGTSIATVSNVLNNRRFVSEPLRQRVMRAVDELGYAANPIARSLKNRRSGAIGVIVSDINCIFFAPMLKGIQNVLSKAGYRMNICDSNYSAEVELKFIRDMQRTWTDGLILAGAADREYCQLLADRDAACGRDGGRDAAGVRPLPVVSLERDLTRYGVDSVMIDSRQSAHLATRHLIELGCRRIVHVAAFPEKGFGIGEERLGGYRDALAEAGLPRDEALVVRGDFSPISGYVALRQLLQAGTRFDGVFAANDQMAVGALRALSTSGIRVPQDVKVVGFDNTFIASILEPALTTISVSSYQMGVQAATQLLARLMNPESKPRLIQMDYELIIRRSTIASARTNWDMTHW